MFKILIIAKNNQTGQVESIKSEHASKYAALKKYKSIHTSQYEIFDVVIKKKNIFEISR